MLVNSNEIAINFHIKKYKNEILFMKFFISFRDVSVKQSYRFQAAKTS